MKKIILTLIILLSLTGCSLFKHDTMENIDIVDLLSKNFNGPKVFFNVGVEDKNY